MVTLMLLAIFRPRVWPEYFSLSILENPLLGINRMRDNDEGNHFEMAPMKYAKVKDFD